MSQELDETNPTSLVRAVKRHGIGIAELFQAPDAVLAAPLILDLARLVTVAKVRGESGPIGELAVFFKTPEGSDEMNLHRQYQTLLEWSARGPEARRKQLRAAGGGATA